MDISEYSFVGNETLNINRNITTTEELNKIADYKKEKWKFNFEGPNCGKWIVTSLPILEWLPEYNFLENAMGELVAGITLAVLNISQGLTNGVLAGIDPICGAYTAFFPVIFYVIFASSRHNSIGTFAVTAMLTKNVLIKFSENTNGTIGEAVPTSLASSYTSSEICTTLSFTVALLMFAMYLLRLDILTVLLSKAVISGFTTGVAIHTFIGQIFNILGMEAGNSGMFYITQTLRDVIFNLQEINWCALLMGTLALIVLSVENFCIKPKFSDFTNIPLPTEILLLINTTLLTYFCGLTKKYGLEVVGSIPNGFPKPQFPKPLLIKDLIFEAATITFVSYVINMSVGLTYSQQLSTPINSDQELFAMGVTNVAGSLFGCMPCCTSLSSTALTVKIRGVTQITYFISSMVALVVLLAGGPIFKYIPKCILAAIIIVPILKLISQVQNFPKFWTASKIDGFLWILTFLSTIFLDIEYGIYIGVLSSLMAIFYLNFRPYSKVLGLLPGTELYLNKKSYQVLEIEFLKIVQLGGSLNYGTLKFFYKEIVNTTHLDVKKYLKGMQKLKSEKSKLFEIRKLHYNTLILDLSMVKDIDPSGVEFLEEIVNLYGQISIKVILAGITGSNFDVIDTYQRTSEKEIEILIFPTLMDAVVFAKTTIFI